jgi:DNA-binding response OmpR family regulator
MNYFSRDMPKVLIAEDSTDLAEMYGIIFSKYQIDFTIISSREHLTRQLVLNKPDIILLDILLNGEDGRKICKEIKQNKDFKNLPIILLSGDTEKLSTYQEYLADDILEKPFNITELIDKIKRLIDKASVETN